MTRAGGGVGATPQLRINLPASLRGTAFRIDDGRCVVGRSTASHVCIDHPDVSRTHAALVRRAGRTTVEDLGSTHGTVVNGVPVDQTRELHHGDQVRFGSVVTVFEDAQGSEPATGVFSGAHAAGMPGATAPAGSAGATDSGSAAGGAPRFDVGHQNADWINNVGGDQYVMAMRDSFLREIAAARTRARRVVLLGFLLFVAGLAGQGWFAYQFGTEWQQTWNSLGQQDLDSTQMPETPEVALGLAGVSSLAFLLGLLLMLVGLVLHISATARRRRANDHLRLLGSSPPSSAPFAPGGSRGFQHRQSAGRSHKQRGR